MNYGPNREWDKQRTSIAPPEQGDDRVPRRVAVGLAISLVVLGSALVKACSSENDDHKDKSIGYAQLDQLYASDTTTSELSPVWEHSPTHIPLDFIVEYAPEV